MELAMLRFLSLVLLVGMVACEQSTGPSFPIEGDYTLVLDLGPTMTSGSMTMTGGTFTQAVTTQVLQPTPQPPQTQNVTGTYTVSGDVITFQPLGVEAARYRGQFSYQLNGRTFTWYRKLD